MCMDRATLCRVDTGRVDAGMTEDVSQPGKVMVDGVEQPGKKMPQIMRKDFLGGYSGILAQSLHIASDVAPVQWSAASGGEHWAAALVMIAQICC